MKVSILRNLNSKNPMVITIVALFKIIVDAANNVASLTKQSRELRAQGKKKEADAKKCATGLYTSAAICEGGHGMDNIVALTGGIMIDIDHIAKEDVEVIIQKVKADSHTLLAHITNSEVGIRAIAHWQMVDDHGVIVPMDTFIWNRQESHANFLELAKVIHEVAYRKAAVYYSNLTGYPVDPQTANINRGAFLCHDENAYLNEQAEPFYITAAEVRAKWQKNLAEKQRMAAMAQRPTVVECSSRFSNVFDLVENWVARRTAYASGSYNRYVCRCGYLLCEFGVSQTEATQWAVARFCDYNQRKVESIIRSCYRNGRFSIREFYNSNNKNNTNTTKVWKH